MRSICMETWLYEISFLFNCISYGNHLKCLFHFISTSCTSACPRKDLQTSSFSVENSHAFWQSLHRTQQWLNATFSWNYPDVFFKGLVLPNSANGFQLLLYSYTRITKTFFPTNTFRFEQWSFRLCVCPLEYLSCSSVLQNTCLLTYSQCYINLSNRCCSFKVTNKD